MTPRLTKLCTGCGVPHGLEAFGVDSSTPDRLKRSCRTHLRPSGSCAKGISASVYGPFPLRTTDLAASLAKGAARRGISLDAYASLFYAGQKHCCTCRTWRDKTAFARNLSQWDRLSGVCMDCTKEHRSLAAPVARRVSIQVLTIAA